MIDYSGLQVCRYLPGRAVVALILAHFVDGDLGEYHELSTGVMVNQPGAEPSRVRALQSTFIHHMLVDQAFTLEAGRTIWGFPKVMADFTIRDGNSSVSTQVSTDSWWPAWNSVADCSSVGLTYRKQVLRSYSHRDGQTLETPFEMSMVGVPYRPGGVRLWLGDHPYAKELASLGLPKRALISASVANVEMSFGDAQEVIPMTTTKPDVDLPTARSTPATRGLSTGGCARTNRSSATATAGRRVDYPAVIEAERNPELFSNAGGIRPDQPGAEMMIEMDDPQHLLRRKLVNSGFTRKRVKDLKRPSGRCATR